MTLGNRIQAIRTSYGMSQEQFGDMLNTTRQTISKWELDQAIPDIRKIVAISKLFCISTEDLLINVTTFEKEGVRFVCGVYRNSTSEIVETEKMAVVYYQREKTLLGAKVYEGNGETKWLTSICEKNIETNEIRYVYQYRDEQGEKKTVANCDTFLQEIGGAFDRKQLDKMECLENFRINHGEYKLHTVREIGIRQCLVEWQKGVKAVAAADYFHIEICTEKNAYVYSIRVEDDNVYCGCSYNIPFDLGVSSYGQYFRIRNYQDNAESYCRCSCDFDYRMPKEIDGVDIVELGQNTNGQCGYTCWFVKRYKDDEIVLDGCGDDEYRYSKNDTKCERFCR